MTAYINKYLIDGIDRSGKNLLIDGINNRRGFHQVFHFSKPVVLDCYNNGLNPDLIARGRVALQSYQRRSFSVLFDILSNAIYANVIANRSHIGECVYAPLYRGYSGDYVFDMEKTYQMHDNNRTRLILLIEDFSVSKHFVDDGESLGTIEARETEQNLFIAAFERSIIPDKRIICVTDQALGGFRAKESILQAALQD